MIIVGILPQSQMSGLLWIATVTVPVSLKSGQTAMFCRSALTMILFWSGTGVIMTPLPPLMLKNRLPMPLILRTTSPQSRAPSIVVLV